MSNRKRFSAEEEEILPELLKADSDAVKFILQGEVCDNRVLNRTYIRIASQLEQRTGIQVTATQVKRKIFKMKGQEKKLRDADSRYFKSRKQTGGGLGLPLPDELSGEVASEMIFGASQPLDVPECGLTKAPEDQLLQKQKEQNELLQIASDGPLDHDEQSCEDTEERGDVVEESHFVFLENKSPMTSPSTPARPIAARPIPARPIRARPIPARPIPARAIPPPSTSPTATETAPFFDVDKYRSMTNEQLEKEERLKKVEKAFWEAEKAKVAHESHSIIEIT